jgi:serine/threonine-protein kinase RsbW
MAGEAYALDGLAVPEELDRLHELLEQVAADHPALPAGEVMMLETAVMEIAGNVIEHGRPPGTVRWHFAVEVGPTLVATLRDSGEEYAVDLAAEMPDVLAEDGRGLPLSRLALDELRYDRDGDANVWTMVRHHDGRGPAAQ